MTSNLSYLLSTPPTNIQLHYSYLLLQKNGKILPLVAVDDLPSTITVLPPLNIISGIPLLQEISNSPSSRYSSGDPEEALQPAAIQFTRRSASAAIKTTPEITPQNPNSVVQHQDDTLSPGFFATYSIKTSPAVSITNRIRDACVLSPDIFSTSPTEAHRLASQSSKNGPSYINSHPQDEDPNPLSAQFIIPSLPIAEPCPTYLQSGSCLCAFRHDIQPITKTSQPFTHRTDEDPSEVESFSDETSYTSIGEDGYLSSIGGNGDAESEPVIRHKSRHSEGPKSAEPCAYFYRRIGCKRGKDCFYVHDSTEKDRDGPTRVPGQALGPGLDDTKYTSLRENDNHANTTSIRKLEGKWRRTENIKGKEVIADSDNGETLGDRKRFMTSQISPVITCPTPGRTLSSIDPAKHIKTHCTFFLRFGECDYWPACKFSHERPEGASRWRSSMLPPKKTPANNNCGGQENEEEATNEKERSEKSFGNDMERRTTIMEGKSNSSFEAARTSRPNSSYEEDDDSDMGFWAVDRGRKEVIEGQLISLSD